MANSKRETIAAAALARMKAITTAGGYQTNVLGASIWKLQETQDQEYPFIWIKDGSEEAEYLTMGGNGRGTDQMTLEVEFMGGVRPGATPGTTEQAATAARTLLTDMIKAVGVDQTWGVTNARTEIKETGIDVESKNRLTGVAYLKISVIYSINRFDYTT